MKKQRKAYSMKSKTTVIVAFVLSILLALPAGAVESKPELFLNLTVTPDDSDHSLTNRILQEDLGGNFGNDISTPYLKDVSITLNGKTLPLDQAIREGAVSPEEIRAWLQLDARSGGCRKYQKSHNGLSVYVYCYDSFCVRVIHDIYETPDGKQHEIDMLDISTLIGFTVQDKLLLLDKDGKYLDREDWGLTFDILSADSQGMTIAYTQYNGQVLGQLVVEYASFYTPDMITCIPVWLELDDSATSLNIPLEKNAEGTFQLSWADLAPGEYCVRLTIFDVYSRRDVPPLTRNYHDYQSYDLLFTVS